MTLIENQLHGNYSYYAKIDFDLFNFSYICKKQEKHFVQFDKSYIANAIYKN